MKKIGFTKTLIVALGVVCLSSCSMDDLMSRLFSESAKAASNAVSIVDEGDGYYKTNNSTPYFSYNDILKNMGLNGLPSEGDLNILVLPIQLKGYPFTSDTLDDMEKVFNGEGSDDTGYWESLSSFYRKSSYGKLNMNFVIGDVYSSSYTPKTLMNTYQDDTTDATNYLLEQAVENYKTINGSTSTQDFDNDSDGQIDGVIMVYSCQDAASSYAIHSIDDDVELFWAYTYWDYENAYYHRSQNSPVGNCYFWMSYDFIYEAVSSPKVDPHTLIHETGHMLGLDDYYAASSGTYSDYNPMGGWTMMDENILDLDIFSKAALGWTNPYVVTGDCTLQINPSESSGDCILIPTSKGWSGSVFDEYLLMELYTPTDLNYLDSHTKYSNREKHYTTYGVKLYHVDARMVRTRTSDQKTWSYTTDTSFSDSYFYDVGATNCDKTRDYVNESFDLVRLISADNTNTFKSNQLSNEKSLFETGDTFKLSKYSKYFPKSDTFNNGGTCDYTITFQEVANDHATIKISSI